MKKELDMRTQLLNAGFKESSLLLVERKFQAFNHLSSEAMTAKGFKLMGINIEAEKVMNSINEICEKRKIGNPLKGETIEYLERVKQ